MGFPATPERAKIEKCLAFSIRGQVARKYALKEMNKEGMTGSATWYTGRGILLPFKR